MLSGSALMACATDNGPAESGGTKQVIVRVRDGEDPAAALEKAGVDITQTPCREQRCNANVHVTEMMCPPDAPL